MEMANTLRDFAALELQQSLQSKLFHGVTSQYRTVDHREPKRICIDAARAGEVSHETSGETVAGTGWIVNFVQRIGRNAEYRIAVNHHRAVFTAFDYQCLRAHFEYCARGAKQIVFVGQLTRFGIV